MKLLLQRDDCDAGRSLGKLSVDGVFDSFTIEPPLAALNPREDHPAIEPGIFDVAITLSPRFHVMLPELLHVPGRFGIRIHPLNTAEESLGCIGLGLSRTHDSVLSSRLALAALQPKIAGALAHGEKVSIEVRNPT